jgi:hypothetical protein
MVLRFQRHEVGYMRRRGQRHGLLFAVHLQVDATASWQRNGSIVRMVFKERFKEVHGEREREREKERERERETDKRMFDFLSNHRRCGGVKRVLVIIFFSSSKKKMIWFF